MRKMSRFAQLFMAASIILAGCETDGAGFNFNDVDVDVKVEDTINTLKVGTSGDSNIEEEKYTFLDRENISFVLESNKAFESTYLTVYYLALEDGVEHIIYSWDITIDPQWAWVYLPIKDISLAESDKDTTGDFRLRLYNGSELLGEVDFKVVEE